VALFGARSFRGKVTQEGAALTRPTAAPSFAPVRGRGRPIAGVLAEALGDRPGARASAAAAAFAEALGWPLTREVRLRALTREGELIAEASAERWAAEVRALAPQILERVGARLGPGVALALDVRVAHRER